MAKKQKEENPDNKSKHELAMEKLNKSYGKGTIFALGSKDYGDYDVISTGSIGFDYITLGVGGVVKGKLYEIMSWEGVGKSTLCGEIVAQCQKAGGVALYIDGEHAVDECYFRALGVDVDGMLIAQPTTGEEGFQIAGDMIAAGGIDLLIIDSDSSLLPKAVIDGDMGDSSIGKKARLNNNVYPKIKTLLANHKVCVIVTSQYREKIGVLWGNPTVTQGGHALKFYTDCRIEMSKSLAKEGDTTYGNLVKLKSTKNKMCPPYRGCSFDIVYGKGIDKIAEIVELAEEFKIAEKYGKSITYNSTKYELETFKILLQDNPELFEEIKQAIIGRIKNTPIAIEGDIISSSEEAT